MFTPETGGVSGLAAAYEGYQAAGQMTAGVMQLGGAITGDTANGNRKADDITIHSSAVAMVTLKVTKDRDKAVKSAAFEGIASSSLTRTVFKSAATVIDTVMNWFSVATPSH